MKQILSGLSCFIFLMAVTSAFAQGNLTPTNAPAPSMKTLAQIEPRTPISSLPFVITNAGSYYLVTNLVGGSGNGITISNNDVTLDLRGFTLSGVANSQHGIFVSGARTNISIENGTVRNFPAGAVNGNNARNSQYRNLRASASGYGLQAGPGSLVTGCTFSENINAGLDANFNCVITSCSALSNRFDGISAFTGALISNCTAGFNGRDGIVVTTKASISDCISQNNTNGIRVISNCYVRNNTLSDNIFCGIVISGTKNRIDSNNSSGGVIGFNFESAGNLIIRNSGTGMSGNAIQHTGNQTQGPLIQSSGAFYFTNSNPWANFSF